MKHQQFHLINSEIRANCIAYISQLNAGEKFVVTIKTEDESRSDAQHRLRWVWFTQAEKQLAGIGKGRTKEAWNLFFKHKYMPVILIEQDEDYRLVFDQYKETCEILPDAARHRYQSQFWERVISTKDMNVKSMSRWLDAIDKFFLTDDVYQLILVTPNDLDWVRK